MPRARLATLAAGAVSFALAAVLTACSSIGGAEGSRHHIYESLDELIGDSKLVVIGVAGESAQVRTEGGLAYSEVTVSIADQLFPSGLGEKPVDEGVSLGPAPKLGASTISVLQVGSASLAAGDEYLLFLVPSQLPGELEDDYFVTGAVAGLYRQTEGAAGFERTSDEDPGLPKTLELSSLQ